MRKKKDAWDHINGILKAIGGFFKKLEPAWPRISRGITVTCRTIWWAMGLLGKAVGTLLLILVCTAAVSAVVFAIFLNHFLDVDMNVDFAEISLNQTSIIYATDADTGEVYEYETLHGTQNRIMVTFAEVPQNMVNALVAIEDKRFWEHKGVDWKRTINAIKDMATGKSSGGSTITQQLIKNITGEKDVTIQRKVKEIFCALEFEKKYTKEAILEGYLNTAYFGEGTYGVKAAALVYFDKELDELTIAEAATIIGITNAPTAYNPYINPEKSYKRRDAILKEMYKQRKIGEDEYKAAIAEEFHLARDEEEEGYDPNSIQSYYTDQIFYDLTAQIMAEKHVDKQIAQSLIYSAGYKIYANIDQRLQGIVDDIFQNDDNFPVAKDSEKPQTAIMLMNPSDGSVLAFGQRGTKTGNLQRVLATMAVRQPGSSIKPVTVYGAAFEAGYISPYTAWDDAPLARKNDPSKAWPKNSGGTRYAGRTPVWRAVQQSVNTIAVRIVTAISPQVSFSYGERLGLSTLHALDADLAPMALGGLTRGVTVRDLTAAYAAYDNRGIYNKPTTYSRVEDSNGETIIDNRLRGVVVMKEKTAYYMTQCLQEVVKGGTATRAQIKGQHVAGKTGTTTDDFDRWFIGYTPHYCAGVWFGYEIPKKIRVDTNTNPGLVMWDIVMEEIHKGLPDQDFFKPDGLKTFSYCLDSGLLPTAACALDPRGKRVAAGAAYPEDVPRGTCNLHTEVSVDRVTNSLATPYCPTENLTKTALLDLTRALPVAGVTVIDEAYTIRGWSNGQITAPEPPEGFFRPISPADPYNTHYCRVHTKPIAEPPPDQPTDPTDDVP